MEGQRIAAFRGPRPRRSLAGKGDLLSAEPRLIAEHGAGAALALQAMAHGDARWFALDRKLKLPAAAGGASDGHDQAPSLSICASLAPTSKRCTNGGRAHLPSRASPRLRIGVRAKRAAMPSIF
jgi:hypothetical protein